MSILNQYKRALKIATTAIKILGIAVVAEAQYLPLLEHDADFLIGLFPGPQHPTR